MKESAIITALGVNNDLDTGEVVGGANIGNLPGLNYDFASDVASNDARIFSALDGSEDIGCGGALDRFLINPAQSVSKYPGLTPEFQARLDVVHRETDIEIEQQKNELLDTLVEEDSLSDGISGGIRRLHRENFIDGPTGLLNREAISGMSDMVNSSPVISAVLLDLDHFKALDRALGKEFGDYCAKVNGRVLGKIMLKHPELSIVRMGGDEGFIFGPMGEKQLKLLIDEAFAESKRIINDFLTDTDRQHVITWLVGNRGVTDIDQVLSQIGGCSSVIASFDTSLLQNDSDVGSKIYLFLDSIAVIQKHRKEKEVAVHYPDGSVETVVVGGRGKSLPPIAIRKVNQGGVVVEYYEALSPEQNSERVANFVPESYLSSNQKKVFAEEKIRLDDIVQSQFNKLIPGCIALLKKFDLFSNTDPHLRSAYTNEQFDPNISLDSLNKILIKNGIESMSLMNFEMSREVYLNFKKVSENIWGFLRSTTYNPSMLNKLFEDVNQYDMNKSDMITKSQLVELKLEYMQAKQEVYYYTGASSPTKLKNAISDPESGFNPENVREIDIELFKSINERSGHIAGDTFLVYAFQSIILSSLKEAKIPRDAIIFKQTGPKFGYVLHDDYLHLEKDFYYLCMGNYKEELFKLNRRMGSDVEEVDARLMEINNKYHKSLNSVLDIALGIYRKKVDNMQPINSVDPKIIIMKLKKIPAGINELIIKNIISKMNGVMIVLPEIEDLRSFRIIGLMKEYGVMQDVDLSKRVIEDRRELSSHVRNTSDRRQLGIVDCFQSERKSYVIVNDKLADPEGVWNLSITDIHGNHLNFNNT